jgi:hypothetical protein
MFRHEEAERRRERRITENFYYDCVYDIVSTANPYHGGISALNHLRTNIVKLNSRKLQANMSDNEASDTPHSTN